MHPSPKHFVLLSVYMPRIPRLLFDIPFRQVILNTFSDAEKTAKSKHFKKTKKMRRMEIKKQKAESAGGSAQKSKGPHKKRGGKKWRKTSPFLFSYNIISEISLHSMLTLF